MRFLICWVLTAGLLHAGSSAVLAKIGGLEITSVELDESIAGLDSAQQAALAKDPAARAQYVRALLVQRLVLKQAVDQKWDQNPAVISKLVRAREAALMESFLQHASAPEDGYPSEAELTAAYETAKPQLLVPRSYRLAQIYIASDKAKLDSTLKQLKAKGTDFAALARTTSEEVESATRGGEIGWLTEDQIQPEMRAALPKLTLGTVSEAIKLQDGWHILKVLDIREPRTPALAEIRDDFVTRLRAERARIKRQDFLAALIKEHPLAINEIELTKSATKP